MQQGNTSYIQPGQAGYAAGQSTGVAPGSSISTSSTVPVQTPQNAIMDQISGAASGMANNIANWAQGAYAQTSNVTDQAVNNFFQTSQQMGTLGNSLTGQYNNLFAPENAQLVADANSYASPTRLATDMGAAGATQAQAGQQAEQNSMQQLQQYGIDPSSGRYAGLINADNVQNAANVAGAENTQNRADVATGQALRTQAVQVGAQLPSAIANVENTGIQANTGAVNSSLANANTGANVFDAANPYLSTAMQVKMPFGQQTSQSQSQSYPPMVGGGSGGGGSGGGSGGNSGSGQGSAAPTSVSQPSSYQAGAEGGAGSPYGGPPGIMSIGGGTSGGVTPTSVPYNDGSQPGYGAAPSAFASGGQVPATASPSGGQQTDDVQAQGPGQAPMQLNANEFVIPQDVALWKGQEFFQNLINDSRKKRMSPGGAPAKPSTSAPQSMGVQ